MTIYYINKSSLYGTDHLIHLEDCPDLPAPRDRYYLGNLTRCEDAMRKARQIYHNVGLCRTCIPEECPQRRKIR